MATGEGTCLERDDNKIDNLHWIDPTELVKSLRLLLSPEIRDHTGHTNKQ